MAEPSVARESRWYFNADQLLNSPSRKCGIDADKELQYRQQTAYLIQEMGQYLRVSQLCINTAIVYMHRFYAFHSFTHFHRNGIAAASLFLAAKVEEQPRKLEHVIKVANASLNEGELTKEVYLEQAQDLVFNENVLLQTLGFDVAIDHPHTHVVKTCHLVKAGKDLAQTSYFMASNSLHLTTMCLQYKPTVVACFCIHLACKWSSWEIPNSTEGRPWFHYVDKSVTTDLLSQLTEEFIQIYQKSPSRLKNKLNSIKALVQGTKTDETSTTTTQQQKSSSVASNGGGNSTTSSNSGSGGGNQVHRSGSTGSGSGGHHHHHRHHHHVPSAGQQPQATTTTATTNSSSSGSLVAVQSQGDKLAKSSSSSSYNNQSSSSSSNRPNKHSTSSTSGQGVPQPNNVHRSGPSAMGGNGSSGGMHNNPNGGAGSRPDGYKSRPTMPQQQQSSQAPSSMSKSSNNSQKYNQQQQPPPVHASDNSLSGGSGSKSNSPTIRPQGASGGSKQPLFMGNFSDNSKRANISDDAFQFSIDDLRDTQDSQDSSQMAAKSQKMQSIFCPDWREDYASGNTEHAKMNLPIGSTGDTKAPQSMMSGNRSAEGAQQQQQQPQRGQQKQGGPPLAVGGMRKMEKKPEQQQQQQRIHPFGGGMSGSSLPSNNNSSIINTGGGMGGVLSMPRQQQQQQQHPHQHSTPPPPPSSSATSSHPPGKLPSKRPYEEMMMNSGMIGDEGGQDLNSAGLTSSASGGVSGSGLQDYRDPKMRRSEVELDAFGGVRQKQPIEKDFTDYRDGTGKMMGGHLSLTGSTLGASGSSLSASKFSAYSNSAHSIETNPDLVSSLLKESLNNTEHTKPFTTIPVAATGGGGNSLLANDRYANGPQQSKDVFGGFAGAQSTVSTSQLDQLINAPPQPFQQMRVGANSLSKVNGMAGGGGDGGVGGGEALAGGEGGEEHYRRTEKKKKKEKHKNKEKDRGTKEERKKHKKDRHKERHHYSSHDEEGASGVVGPLKLKIAKDSSGGVGGGSYGSEAMGGASLKIKIPRTQEPLGPLKIKISKGIDGVGMEATGAGTVVGGGGYHKKKEKEKASKRDY